jgi:hypothetical protein
MWLVAGGSATAKNQIAQMLDRGEKGKVNAHRIVEAVNMHDALMAKAAKFDKVVEALEKNVHHCEYIEGGKRCPKVALYNVSDYDWSEYLCEEHKDLCSSPNMRKRVKPVFVPKLKLAEKALADAKQ